MPVKVLAAQLRTHICDYAPDTKRFEYTFIETAHGVQTKRIQINTVH